MSENIELFSRYIKTNHEFSARQLLHGIPSQKYVDSSGKGQRF